MERATAHQPDSAVPGAAVAKITHFTDPGTRYHGLNQDRLVCEAAGGAHLWAVLDGHCPLGEHAAEQAAIAIAKEFRTQLASGRAPTEADLKRLFDVGHRAVLAYYGHVPTRYRYPSGPGRFTTFVLAGQNAPDGPIYRCAEYTMPLDFGTTCSVALYHPSSGVLLVGHVGDSRVLLVSRNASSEPSPTAELLPSAATHGSAPLTPLELTVDHNAQNTAEVARIKKDFSSKAAFRDGYLFGTSGAGHHLAVTRALGHRLMADCGVIPMPQLSSHSLDGTAYALILASDGVWDALDAAGAATAIAEGRGAEDLVRSALSQPHVPAADRDNTTAIVVYFK